ncbi:helix-turn-helix domain-containing protein [Sinorhizobium fredii]
MTADEAAARLAVSKKTLMRHVAEGQIGFVNVGTEGRMHRRFTASHLMAFITNRHTIEVPKCLSIKPAAVRTTATISKSMAIAFTALPRPGAKGTRRP